LLQNLLSKLTWQLSTVTNTGRVNMHCAVLSGLLDPQTDFDNEEHPPWLLGSRLRAVSLSDTYPPASADTVYGLYLALGLYWVTQSIAGGMPAARPCHKPGNSSAVAALQQPTCFI
jgi:hypothetical protein